MSVLWSGWLLVIFQFEANASFPFPSRKKKRGGGGGRRVELEAFSLVMQTGLWFWPHVARTTIDNVLCMSYLITSFWMLCSEVFSFHNLSPCLEFISLQGLAECPGIEEGQQATLLGVWLGAHPETGEVIVPSAEHTLVTCPFFQFGARNARTAWTNWCEGQRAR